MSLNLVAVKVSGLKVNLCSKYKIHAKKLIFSKYSDRAPLTQDRAMSNPGISVLQCGTIREVGIVFKSKEIWRDY